MGDFELIEFLAAADTVTIDTDNMHGPVVDWQKIDRDGSGRPTDIRGVGETLRDAIADALEDAKELAEARGVRDYTELGRPDRRVPGMDPATAFARLEEIRASLDAENISMGELAELQDLAGYIQPGDMQLLEAAGIPESEALIWVPARWTRSTTMWSTLTEQGTARAEDALCQGCVDALGESSSGAMSLEGLVSCGDNEALECRNCGATAYGPAESTL